MYSDPRAAYMDASVATATPARLLVMLYERLVLDVRKGMAAQQHGDHAEAHTQLLHAQDIVLELRATLVVDAWEGGPGLAAGTWWMPRSRMAGAMSPIFRSSSTIAKSRVCGMVKDCRRLSLTITMSPFDTSSLRPPFTSTS